MSEHVRVQVLDAGLLATLADSQVDCSLRQGGSARATATGSHLSQRVCGELGSAVKGTLALNTMSAWCGLLTAMVELKDHTEDVVFGRSMI